MSKIKKVIYGVVGVSVLTAAALPIFAGNGHGDGHGHGHSHGHSHGHGMESGYGSGSVNNRSGSNIFQNVYDQLNETQRNVLLGAANESRQTWLVMDKQMLQYRKDMMELNPKAKDYDAKVARLVEKEAELSRQMTLMRASMKSTMADVLTDAQMREIKKTASRYE